MYDIRETIHVLDIFVDNTSTQHQVERISTNAYGDVLWATFSTGLIVGKKPYDDVCCISWAQFKREFHLSKTRKEVLLAEKRTHQNV